MARCLLTRYNLPPLKRVGASPIERRWFSGPHAWGVSLLICALYGCLRHIHQVVPPEFAGRTLRQAAATPAIRSRLAFDPSPQVMQAALRGDHFWAFSCVSVTPFGSKRSSGICPFVGSLCRNTSVSCLDFCAVQHCVPERDCSSCKRGVGICQIVSRGAPVRMLEPLEFERFA